jgi:predicted RNA polymerase sigma factor
LFNSARFRSRFTHEGNLVDLEGQDRSLWNRDLILLACDYLMRSRDDLITSYHLEASIAYFHCMADNFGSTDWKAIANLYARLLDGNANPFVELNYAIALYYSGQKQRAFEILHVLEQHRILGQYYLLNCTLGTLYAAEGNRVIAKPFFLKAIGQTSFIKEQELVQKRIDEIA